MGALDCVRPEGMKATESTEVFAISNPKLNDTRRDFESQCSKSSGSTQHSYLWTLLVDIPLFILVLTVITLLELNYIPTLKSGFYCKDPALSYHFYGDTVTAAVLMTTLLLFPFAVILPTELLFLNNDCLQRSRVSQAIRNTLWLYKSYIVGLTFNLCVVEVMKAIIGSPRPAFFQLCNPDRAQNCTENEYITEFTCTSTTFSAWAQSDASHSFPSGHTSLSVYCGFFLAWYLQRRAFSWQSRSIGIVPVLQLLLITYAAVCSLTRITDHRHHWWDVLAGTAVGVMTCLYSALLLCNNFCLEPSKSAMMNEGLQSTTTLLYDAPRPTINIT